MKNGGWPMDLRESGNCGMEIVYKPGQPKPEIKNPVYFEEIPLSGKNYKRLHWDLLEFNKKNKWIWR